MEQNERSLPTSRNSSSHKALRAIFVAGACGLVIASACNNGRTTPKSGDSGTTVKAATTKDTVTPPGAAMGPLDTALYNKLLVHMANGDSSHRWPVHTAYPNPGAILPFNRIVAYYGNLYSKNMGVLGEYPPKEMLQKLQVECKKWQAADPTIPVLPCLHYIAVTAQGAPGKDGKYRARMPFKHIDSILHMAARINAIVFLDIQVGFSNVQTEVPQLEKYLKMPKVKIPLELDPAGNPVLAP